MFIINCKNYNEISGEKISKLAVIAERISKKHKIQIALAPPHHQLALIKKSKLLVFAQHLDDAKVGSTTGYMIPEIVKKSKINGSLINHSEHRIPSKEVTNRCLRKKCT
jgi:triosephosphate isomerase